LPALEHHTYSEDDVEEGGIRAEVGKKVKLQFYFYSKSPLLDVGGFAIKQGIKKYLPKYLCKRGTFHSVILFVAYTVCFTKEGPFCGWQGNKSISVGL
jgi:hypothetical protein